MLIVIATGFAEERGTFKPRNWRVASATYQDCLKKKVVAEKF
jgi:hypothetical protein